MFRTGLVAKTQPAAIRIFDYYEPGNFNHRNTYCSHVIVIKPDALKISFNTFLIYQILQQTKWPSSTNPSVWRTLTSVTSAQIVAVHHDLWLSLTLSSVFSKWHHWYDLTCNVDALLCINLLDVCYSIKPIWHFVVRLLLTETIHVRFLRGTTVSGNQKIFVLWTLSIDREIIVEYTTSLYQWTK